MRFAYAILYVPDVAAALAFWERAFGLDRRFLHESGTYGELETGATALAFAAESMAPVAIRRNDPGEPPAAAEIALMTEDVAGAYGRALAAGASPVKAPERKPWGQTVAYVRDGDGILVELCGPVGG